MKNRRLKVPTVPREFAIKGLWIERQFKAPKHGVGSNKDRIYICVSILNDFRRFSRVNSRLVVMVEETSMGKKLLS